MFRTDPLSIISNFPLYTQQWFMSYVICNYKIYFWNKTLHVSDSSSVNHRDFFTVHTAMVSVICLMYL